MPWISPGIAAGATAGAASDDSFSYVCHVFDWYYLSFLLSLSSLLFSLDSDRACFSLEGDLDLGFAGFFPSL